MVNPSTAPLQFADFGLSVPVMNAIASIGYVTPSPIQAGAIPALLTGRDFIGLAQTGTGKTAAFALPIASRLTQSGQPQALILVPTRELAMQVAEALEQYCANLPHHQVLALYGGQPYRQQLSALKKGVQIVVGTPGRVMDHLQRRTLDVSAIRTLVLDEADEMLRMGFIDDVESVIQQLPSQRQIALFSATLSPQIRRIAQAHLRNPVEVTIATRTATASTVRQRYWCSGRVDKWSGLLRIIAAEPFDAMLIFVRTKAQVDVLASRLQEQGLAVAALHGDLPQAHRERTVANLKAGQLNLVVATDVAARGLDVERISHVLNYDIPFDTESYVHRIGRTGRAGRDGQAIVFITPREKKQLRAIERATKAAMTEMELPSLDAVKQRQQQRFAERIRQALAQTADSSTYREWLDRFIVEQEVSAIDVAAALAGLLQDTLLPLHNLSALIESPAIAVPAPSRTRQRSTTRAVTARSGAPTPRAHHGRTGLRWRSDADPVRVNESWSMERYRIAVGRQHGVKPANIVGAIANEAGLDSRHIGRITIHQDHSTLDLPEQMPREILQHLKTVWVAGQQLQICHDKTSPETGGKLAGVKKRLETKSQRSTNRQHASHLAIVNDSLGQQ